MNASAFDTLGTADALEAAGLDRAHAKTIAAEMRKAATAEHDALATRADLAVLRADFTALRSDLGALRSEVRWMFGFQAALILAIAARLFGLVRFPRPSTGDAPTNRPPPNRHSEALRSNASPSGSGSSRCKPPSGGRAIGRRPDTLRASSPHVAPSPATATGGRPRAC